MNPDKLSSGPRIAITMGCPAGIGPEVIVKAFSNRPEWLSSPDLIVIGDMAVLQRAARILDLDLRFNNWGIGAPLASGAINLLVETNLDPESIPPGKQSSTTGRASYAYIQKAIKLCLEKRLLGMVTAPISKMGLRLAGIQFPGHTEILATFSKTNSYAMMMAGKHLKVVLVTIHHAIKDVPSLLTTESILDKILLTHKALTLDFGIKDPKIAVCGLNPHAGEGGIMGDEESRIISPAIKMASEKGINVTGPYPPDTVFYKASKGNFDAVVCQYHDQGLIPFKLLHFEDGVNVTIGLPFVRTSVDHGTAYDIAGMGIASSSSLEAAIELAKKMVKNRKAEKETAQG